MNNKMMLFFKSPVKNTTEFTKETGTMLNTCRKRFFCSKTPGMAEDFHEFAKHEAGKGRNRLTAFYLAQEIRGLKACLKSCGKPETPDLNLRLYQAHLNLASVDFARGKLSSLKKAKLNCDAAGRLLTLQSTMTHIDSEKASSLLHETSAKAEYLFVIRSMLNNFEPEVITYEPDAIKKSCKAACENMEIALNKLLRIERNLENQPAANTRIGQLYFWLGELKFEAEGGYSAKEHYEHAIKRLPQGDYIELAKSRLWDIEWYDESWDRVRKHNESIKGRYREEKENTDPWDPARYKWWDNQRSGTYTSTDPFQPSPDSPKPKYEDSKLALLSKCPIAPKW